MKKRPHLGGENVRVRGIVDVAARDQIVAGAKDAQFARRGGADHGRHEQAVLGAVHLCARGGCRGEDGGRGNGCDGMGVNKSKWYETEVARCEIRARVLG